MGRSSALCDYATMTTNALRQCVRKRHLDITLLSWLVILACYPGCVPHTLEEHLRLCPSYLCFSVPPQVLRLPNRTFLNSWIGSY